MDRERIMMGVATALLAGFALWHRDRLVGESRKGRRLAGWFGHAVAMRLFVGFFLVLCLFGVALALGLIEPVRWGW